MSSTSSSRTPAALAFGAVAGARGLSGEVTIRVASGVAQRWERLPRVLVGRGDERDAAALTVERARAYKDRLVLKLLGVDDANAAYALRGCTVWARAEDIPALPEGTYFAARLVGMKVLDEANAELGTVVDVTGVGGADMLVVQDPNGGEVLVPLASEIVRSISESEGIARVRLPDGLADINRGGGTPA